MCTCRDCENKRKRKLRKEDKQKIKRGIKPAKVSPFRPSVESLIEKYDAVMNTLGKHGVDLAKTTMSAVETDMMLGNV